MEKTMKTMVRWGALTLCVLSAVGCGAGHDALMKEQIQCWNEAADVLATIHDEASAAQAKLRLEAILDHLAEVDRKGRALPPPLEEEQVDLRQHNQEAVTTATTRINQEMQRAIDVPGAGPVVYEFHQQVMHSLN
jgi:hypothetical protein